MQRVVASPPDAATRWRHLPNLLSALRLLLALPVALAIGYRDYPTALVLAALAALSDALDGFLARRFRWQSRLGATLDPLADKLLLVGCFIALTYVGAVPLELTLLVLARDVVIVAGALAWRVLLGPLTARPSLLSKLNTLAQIGFVLAVLLTLVWSQAMPPPLRGPAWAVGALTVASGIDYVLRWGVRARRAWRKREQR
jgi:cardiolipin synthase